jgi:Chlorite dismutase
MRTFSFAGGETGEWRIERIAAVTGESLPAAPRLRILQGPDAAGTAAWCLRGITSNERYVNRGEKGALVAVQPALGRPEARHAALIPIRKSSAWWALPQDERRAIFEEQSSHIATGLEYLPAVARRLHHCRDLATDEPFDFLTWFEYAPQDVTAFEKLVARLRSSPEWSFVDREVDVRLIRT